MTPVLLVCLLIGSVSAVDLSCSDNATCIEELARDLVRSLRQQKAVRLFDAVTIEPLATRQGRSREGLWSFIESNAVSFDWNDFTFKVSVPRDGRDDALDLEMYLHIGDLFICKI
ncbi:Uncharacterized protein OBRU01_10959 [Operophtera brumata]|uniref:Uncharacterized protein n=1 Tax=Operophtera brumata TaxID=104452 RepID=A0A0L7LCR5_OPEBR|nr:Uncharacterized protein OBRU01_10959 [Operophtera brumata]